jgi:hypothetical protein
VLERAHDVKVEALSMCSHTNKYVSSYHYICVLVGVRLQYSKREQLSKFANN